MSAVLLGRGTEVAGMHRLVFAVGPDGTRWSRRHGEADEARAAFEGLSGWPAVRWLVWLQGPTGLQQEVVRTLGPVPARVLTELKRGTL